MTPLPAVPNVLKFRLDWAIEGDSLANTIHYARYAGGPPSPANCVTMAEAAVSAAETGFQDLCANLVGVENCQVTDLSSSTSAQGEGGTAWVGTAGSNLLSPATAAVVSHQILRRYRGGKPRNYLPLGVSSFIGTTGVWGAGVPASYLAGWNAFVSALLAAGAGCTIDNIVNVSYYEGYTVVISPTTGRARNVPKLRGAPVIDTIVASVVPQQIGSQRRRNRDA